MTQPKATTIAAALCAFVVGVATSYAWFTFAPGAGEGAGPGASPASSVRWPTHPAARAPKPADVAGAVNIASLADVHALASDFEQTAALYVLLRGADQHTVERLLGEADGLRSRRARLATKAVIYARFAELAPLAAVDRVLAENIDKLDMLHHVFAAWAKLDLEAALAHVETLANPLRSRAANAVLSETDHLDPDRRRAIAAAFSMEDLLHGMEALGELDDPSRAWRKALDITALDDRAERLFQIATQWVQRDPHQALTAAMDLPSGGPMGGVAPFMIARWAEDDADGALKWVLSQPPSRVRTAMLGSVAQAIAEAGPQEALALAETFDGADRREMARAALTVWAQTDPQAALRALGEVSDAPFSNDIRFSILAQWATAAPEQAFEWARAQKASLENMHLVTMPLQQMAVDDPQRALRLAEKLDGMRKQQALAQIVSTWADSDPRAAAAWLESASGDVSQATAAVAFAFARESPTEALAWASTLPKQARQVALQSLVSAAAMHAPEDAVEVVANIRDPALREEANVTLVMAWSQNAPQDAAEWVGRNADARNRPFLYRQLFHSWAFHDRDAAAAHLRGLSRQDERDSAALGLMAATAFDDADYAERIYADIRGEDAKREAGRQLYHALAQIDPARAERFRKQAGIKEAAPGQSNAAFPSAPVVFRAP